MLMEETVGASAAETETFHKLINAVLSNGLGMQARSAS